MLSENAVGEPLAGKPHERFDGRTLETERSSPPRQRSTLRRTSGSGGGQGDVPAERSAPAPWSDPTSATAVWTRCAVESNRRRSSTEAARATRSIASASCWSPAPNASMTAVASACCWGCASATPETRFWAPGWPRNQFGTCISPMSRPRRPRWWTRPSPAVAEDDVEEIRSLGRTLAAWRTEILAHHETGASNGPTEGLNLCVKRVKRCGFGLRRFEHYRLRVLLHAGGVTWPRRPSPPRIRTRSPHSNA